MGEAKDSMKPTNPDEKFGFFKSKKKAATTAEGKAPSFADIIGSADETLAKLIMKKEVDFKTERGQEEANRKSLAILQTMMWHLDQIAELGNQYLEQK